MRWSAVMSEGAVGNGIAVREGSRDPFSGRAGRIALYFGYQRNSHSKIS